MASYWVIRTDKKATDFLWRELEEGRLRQGWGFDLSQNLVVIRDAVSRGEPLSAWQASTWRGNRRLLDSEPDAVRVGDIVVAPHLPRRGEWSVARVSGRYKFDIPSSKGDYGHILPVDLLTVSRPVNPYEMAVSAKLRQTMRNPLRMWNINSLSVEVDQIIHAIKTDQPGDSLAERLPDVLAGLEDLGWKSFQHHYHGAEFEKPCILLLELLYGKENVEHTGGSGERGADAICQFIDPLGVQHRLAVQIKMWEWDADWTRPLDQVRQAYGAYEGITAAAIISTSKGVTATFADKVEALQNELRIPIKVILREELLRMFISNLPQMVGPTEQV